MEDIIVKTIPGNMYHLNTSGINFTKKSHWLVIIIVIDSSSSSDVVRNQPGEGKQIKRF